MLISVTKIVISVICYIYSKSIMKLKEYMQIVYNFTEKEF